MEQDKLRKADLVTSLIIIIFGSWICMTSLQMPMADSYGGVQNVWYVSPAIFPLFIGGAIALLGLVLLKIAVSKLGGISAAAGVLAGVFKSGDRGISRGTFRFLAIAVLFTVFVYLYIPRVDFFLSSLIFLVAFINMFHLEDDTAFVKIFVFYLAGSAVTLMWFVFGLNTLLEKAFAYPGDILSLCFLAALLARIWKLVRYDAGLVRRFRTGTIVAFAAPFVLGPIFKFFLLVPLPFEGMVVELLDNLWYMDFSS